MPSTATKAKKPLSKQTRQAMGMGLQGNAISKARLSKNRQNKARYMASKARHNGKTPLTRKVISTVASPHAQAINNGISKVGLAAMQRVRLATTHVQWFMGVARYYTMPTNLVGYVIRQVGNTAWVYIPPKPSQAQPAQYIAANTANNGLAQYCIAAYLPPPKPKKTPAQPAKPAKPKKPKPSKKPPTNWGAGGNSKPTIRKASPPAKPAK